MLILLKEYVAEMGVTDGFYEAMVNTSPSQVKMFRDREIEALVPIDDPVQDEIQTANNAHHYGLSTAEMRRREAAASVCDAPPGEASHTEAWRCAEAIRWGISRRDYDARIKGAQRACYGAADTGNSAACVRNFLLGR